MQKKTKLDFFRTSLLAWFKINKRIFPWRVVGLSSYEIILSEILLQRTKAETVAKYYSSILQKFPNWDILGNATVDEIKAELFPLGLYNHRAKRIFQIAQEIKKRKGELPSSENEIRELNLSTLYLINAYELLILNKKRPLLDVNMSRVIMRFFGIANTKDLRSNHEMQLFATNLVKIRNCKDLNWAILDFAAIVCKAQKPVCSKCPIAKKCHYNKKVLKIERDFSQEKIKLDFNNNVNKNKKIKLLSLFSGCGGMDIGFEGGFEVHSESVNLKTHPEFKGELIDNNFYKLPKTPYEIVFANDILKEAKLAWTNYFSKFDYDPEVFTVASIVDLVKAHKDGAKIFPDGVDIVTGGFPCQDFSLAGKRKGFNSQKDHFGNYIESDLPTIETRGKLYMWLREVVEITRPKIFIAENVKGLVNLHNVKEIIQSDFSSINSNGYLVLEPLVLHAANYGIPQTRERVIFIGIKKSALSKEALEALTKLIIPEEYNPYPIPSHSFSNKAPNLKEPVRLKSIFNSLQEPGLSSDLSQSVFSKAKFMGKHCQGQSEINLEGLSPTIRAEHHGNIEFRRLSKINGGRYLEELELGLTERRLTPRECALIQTFPPSYEFVRKDKNGKFIVSASSAYKLIGNAVPPLLGYHIAKRIEKLWDLFFEGD